MHQAKTDLGAGNYYSGIASAGDGVVAFSEETTPELHVRHWDGRN